MAASPARFAGLTTLALCVASGFPAAAHAADVARVARPAAVDVNDARARHDLDPFALTRRAAHLAQVVYPTQVRGRPGAGTSRGRLGTEARWGGGPVQLLVLRSALDDRGRRWLRVRLPERPNDRAGWILSDRTRVSKTPWRIVIATRSRRMTVRRAGKPVRRFSAVVGAPATPTPRGLFAISERIRQSQGVLGPWALHLTAHSNVLDDYGGGKGRVALHGRSGALLADPLGTARSHGCVRLDNRAVAWLARRATEGTPVLIRR
jgi:L,D-transpeptidase catalytic domain